MTTVIPQFLGAETYPTPISTLGQQTPRLHFSMERQLLPNWCWAAVAASVANYYASSRARTQEAVGSEIRGRDCGLNGQWEDGCDAPDELVDALKFVQHNGGQTIPGVTEQALRDQLIHMRPVGCLMAIGDQIDNRHYIAVIGVWKTAGNITMVDIGDPLHDTGTVVSVPFDRLRIGYRSPNDACHEHIPTRR